MKFFILILSLLAISGCVSRATTVSESAKSAQPAPTTESSDSNAVNFPSYSDYRYDQTALDELKEANERFRQVPDEFKSVDFRNFKYDFGRMKNGEFEDIEAVNPPLGGETFTLTDVFYIDLIGDEKKEAVVFLYRVSCGASCDGGADIVYFYSSNNGKAKLIGILPTGANSGGCSLKSFTIKNKKIYVEQFGRCERKQTFEERSTFACKFCAKDETHSVYLVAKNKLFREAVEIFETKILNVMNSPAFISIND